MSHTNPPIFSRDPRRSIESFLPALANAPFETAAQATLNKKGVSAAVMKYLRAAFNDVENLFVGESEENQALGRQIGVSGRQRRDIDPEQQPQEFERVSKELAEAQIDVGETNAGSSLTDDERKHLAYISKAAGRLPKVAELREEAREIARDDQRVASPKLARAQERLSALDELIKVLRRSVPDKNQAARTRLKAGLAVGVATSRRMAEILGA